MGKTALMEPRETREWPEPPDCGDLEEKLAHPEKMAVPVLKATQELPEHMAYTETPVQREKKATREDLEHKVFREHAEKMAHRVYRA